jgi:hypothetical protein
MDWFMALRAAGFGFERINEILILISQREVLYGKTQRDWNGKL